MSELKIFENPEFGSVRTVKIENEPWFVGKDVAVALGYVKPIQAVHNNVDEDDCLKKGLMDSMGRNQETILINESGLYALIFGSRLESAKQFKKWVTSEILPSVRKTGGYISGQETLSDDDLLERALMVAQRRIAEREKVISEQEKKIAELKPESDYFRAVCDARLLTNFRDAGKELGMSQSQFVGWLKREGYIYTTNAGEIRPMEAYRSSGLFQMKSYVNPYSGYSGIRTYLTPKGVQTFKLLLEANGIMPDALPKHGGRNRKQKKS